MTHRSRRGQGMTLASDPAQVWPQTPCLAISTTIKSEKGCGPGAHMGCPLWLNSSSLELEQIYRPRDLERKDACLAVTPYQISSALCGFGQKPQYRVFPLIATGLILGPLQKEFCIYKARRRKKKEYQKSQWTLHWLSNPQLEFLLLHFLPP